MTAEMWVDTDDVNALAGVLAGAADQVGSLDPGASLTTAAVALPESASATELSGLAGTVGRAIGDTARRLREMSEAATSCASGYSATDDAVARSLGGR